MTAEVALDATTVARQKLLLIKYNFHQQMSSSQSNTKTVFWCYHHRMLIVPNTNDVNADNADKDETDITWQVRDSAASAAGWSSATPRLCRDDGDSRPGAGSSRRAGRQTTVLSGDLGSQPSQQTITSHHDWLQHRAATNSIKLYVN